MMMNLADFPPPHSAGEVTVCEYDCHLVSSEVSHAALPITDEFRQFPSLKVPSDYLRSCEAKENTAKSAFLSGSVNVWGRLSTTWHDRGINGFLEELSNLENDSVRNNCIIKCAKSLSTIIQYFCSLHGSLYPHLSITNEDIVEDFSSSCEWKKSPIRCLSWHPFMNKCAMGLQDDSVCVETHGSSVKPILKYRSQKNVADLAWRPYSSSHLAVASQSGILVWTLEPSSLITRPSSSCVQVLSLAGHGPVTSIAWSPKDGTFLLSASPADSSMVIWCVASEEYVPLHRFGGGVSLVRWSPTGDNIFAATPSFLFRIWETDKWTCEKWSNLEGRCQAACWSPDGMDLLFTTTDQRAIFHVSLRGSKQAIPLFDVSEIEYFRDDDTVKAGGRIEQMVWDSAGERLAVSFRGENGPCELVALFRTRTKPSLEIYPCGYVQGPANSFPSYICFRPNYEKGALLSVCWSCGDVSHIPLLFLASQSVKANTSSIQYDETKSILSPLRQRTIYSEL